MVRRSLTAARVATYPRSQIRWGISLNRQLLLSLSIAAAALLVIAVAVWTSRASVDAEPVAAPSAAAEAAGPEEPAAPTPSSSPLASPSPVAPPSPAPRLLGEPWGSVSGLLQFRGNPTHTFYGLGPAPTNPEIAWRYPDTPMCSEEVLGTRKETVTEPDGTETTREVPNVKKWCGTGWTGQPVVWERPDGIVELIVGAFDGAIHFLDTATGRPTRPTFQTGQMIKGSVTLDPDGFPLLYAGSRDNYLRVIALDREVPTELWRLGPNSNGVWNNDWDGNPSVVDGVLYTGGEDSWFYAVELNRAVDGDGLVTVEPEVLVQVPGFDSALFANVGDRNVSIESSVAIHDRTAYFVNSGGRVVGLDISKVTDSEVPIVFDYWVGDDADASIVIDDEGMLYVSVEYERKTARATEVGQLLKLDPGTDGDPRVWGLSIPPRPGPPDDGGTWSTPALYGDLLYTATHPGELLVVDRHTGEVVHRETVGYHEWSSPAVVEDPDTGRATLIVGLCEASGVRAYDLADPRSPTELWTVHVGGCIESTPAVWKGAVYVGSRDGYVYGFRDR